MFKLPEYIQKLMSTFTKAKYQIYLVGGGVRNLLMKRETQNWDFATNATPEQILTLFPDGFYHNTYGTVSIPVETSQQDVSTIVEITPFRKESDYKDTRHPETISWAKTIEEDLARRDFTINAIAYDGKKIIDLWEGQKHIDEKKIAAVGNADERFQEDALRLMRAVRLTAQLGFLIEEKTLSAIKKNAHLISKVSQERIRDEIIRILSSDNPSEGILFLRNTGLLSFIIPELDACFAVSQISPKRHHIYDVGTHLIMALKHCPSKDPITRLATLLHDIGKVKTYRKDPKTQIITFYNHEVVSTILVTKIADRLKLSNKEKEKLIQLVKYHQFSVSEIQTDKAVRRFIREVGKEYVQDMLDLRTGDRIGSGSTPTSWRLELFKKRLIDVQKQPFAITDLKINGDDVMKKLNIQPSRQVGEILKKLFEQVVEGKLKNERKILLKELSVCHSREGRVHPEPVHREGNSD